MFSMHNTTIWTTSICFLLLLLLSHAFVKGPCHVPCAAPVFNPMSRENRHDATNNGLMVCYLFLVLFFQEDPDSEIKFSKQKKDKKDWHGNSIESHQTTTIPFLKIYKNNFCQDMNHLVILRPALAATTTI